LRLTELEALKLRLENTIRYLSQLSKDQAALLGDLEAEAVINALAPNNWFFPEQPDEVPCPCVYFIHFPHYNSVKIGYTEDLAQRVRNLLSETGSRLSSTIQILAVILTDSPRRVEAGVHLMLHEYRQEGEWFTTNAALDFINTWSETPQSVPVIRENK
jgi:hypothetical protein